MSMLENEKRVLNENKRKHRSGILTKLLNRN